jgi:protein-disulfide isomerase
LETDNYAWIEDTGVALTPTFFINGYELPKGYVIDDLLAMTPALANSIEESIKTETTLV